MEEGNQVQPAAKKNRRVVAVTKATVRPVYHLRLTLRGSEITKLTASAESDGCPDDSETASMLQKYGRVQNSISREILVPPGLTLRQLHYVIQRLFGWKNSHLHMFRLPEKLFASLVPGTFKENRNIWGTYLKITENTNVDDWDQDYDSRMSDTKWLRSKYMEPYVYSGFTDYWLENQAYINELMESISYVHFLTPKGPENNESCSWMHLQAIDLPQAFFGELEVDNLIESLRMDQIFTDKLPDLGGIRQEINFRQSQLLEPYCEIRKYLVRNQTSKKYPDAKEIRKYYLPFLEADQPKKIHPITSCLEYEYDFGDGWTIDISLEDIWQASVPQMYREQAREVRETGAPVCIAKDGLSVMDDCGNVHGYSEFLRDLYEGDEEEQANTKDWGSMMGWSNRMSSPKNSL